MIQKGIRDNFGCLEYLYELFASEIVIWRISVGVMKLI